MVSGSASLMLWLRTTETTLEQIIDECEDPYRTQDPKKNGTFTRNFKSNSNSEYGMQEVLYLSPVP